MKTIRKFDNAFSANICKGVLEEAGIQAFVLNENLVWSTGAVNRNLLSIDVVVDDEMYDKALEVLASGWTEENLPDQGTAPETDR